MKQKLSFAILIFGFIIGFSGSSPSQVSAQASDPCASGPTTPGCSAVTPEPDKPDCEPGSDGCCGGVKTSIIGGDICGGEEDGTQNGTIYKMLIEVLNILTAGIGIAAVGGIAYGALLYTTAENKPDQTKKAIGIITNVVIGIVAYALMYVLLNFLIPGGVFTS